MDLEVLSLFNSNLQKQKLFQLFEIIFMNYANYPLRLKERSKICHIGFTSCYLQMFS